MAKVSKAHTKRKLRMPEYSGFALKRPNGSIGINNLEELLIKIEKIGKDEITPLSYYAAKLNIKQQTFRDWCYVSTNEIMSKIIFLEWSLYCRKRAYMKKLKNCHFNNEKISYVNSDNVVDKRFVTLNELNIENNDYYFWLAKIWNKALCSKLDYRLEEKIFEKEFTEDTAKFSIEIRKQIIKSLDKKAGVTRDNKSDLTFNKKHLQALNI